MAVCPKCNSIVEDDSQFCNNCGYRLSGEKEQSGSQIKTIIIAIVVAAILIVIGFFVYNMVAKAKYIQDSEACAYSMINGAADAETACNKIVAVWNNSIWQTEDAETDSFTKDENGYFYDDFNDALDSLYSDSSFQKDLDSIQENVNEVNSQIKKLQNPPKGCEEIHDLLMAFYDGYYELTNAALNPNGSLTTFSDQFTEADNSAVKNYEKLRVYFE